MDNFFKFEFPTKVLKISNHPKYGYCFIKHIQDMSELDGESNAIETEQAYCLTTGVLIGDKEDAKMLCVKLGIRKIEKAYPNSGILVGFQPIEQKWYGCTHRGVEGFGIGDMLFESKYIPNEQTPFVECGKKRITTLDEAREAAVNFAKYLCR